MIKLSFPSTRDRWGYGKRYQSANSSGVNLKAFNEALGAATAGDDTPAKVPKEYPVTVVPGDEDSSMDTLQNDPEITSKEVKEQAHEVIRSTKLGISATEYRRRKRLVREAYKNCRLQPGDTCFPINLQDRNKYGKMIVVGILDDYDNYGDVEWNENPLILCVSPLNNRNYTVNCSYNWAFPTAGGNNGVC